jgi:hypothetical protein
MKPQLETTDFTSGLGVDFFAEIVSAIQRERVSSISVPDLSRLLDVKATTLNARFRREHITVQTVGRTNFVSLELALRLAELHKYALLGWPTLEQASRLTGVKSGTIKARCEKGQLEGYSDLTKRLRVNPGEIETLQLRRRSSEKHPKPPMAPSPLVAQSNGRKRTADSTPLLPMPAGNSPRAPSADTPNRTADWTPPRPRPFVMPPAPQPKIHIITAQHYGLAEPEGRPEVRGRAVEGREPKRKASGYLSYDAERPFSVSDCVVGRSIRYGQYDGTIVKVIDDPYCPRIQVKIPEHQHPLMREVFLRVGTRRA